MATSTGLANPAASQASESSTGTSTNNGNGDNDDVIDAEFTETK